MSKQYVYGIGGYDEKKPNNNLIAIEEYDDETGQLVDVQDLTKNKK